MNTRAEETSHDDIVLLLPWYVNETLADADRELVDTHLEACGQCRDELALCAEMRSAMQAGGATPIPAATTAAELLNGQGSRSPLRRVRRQQVWRVAAAVAAVALLVSLGLNTFGPAMQSNQQFDTVIGEPAAGSMDYVLSLRFDDGVPSDAQASILRELGATTWAPGETTDSYLVTVRLSPQSLGELEERAAGIAARDNVAEAEFIALQVPVR